MREVVKEYAGDSGPNWILDLDGVVWLADQPIPGAARAIDRLDQLGEQLLFVTNFSALTKNQAEANSNPKSHGSLEKHRRSHRKTSSVLEQSRSDYL